jgi:hypothetical protein
MADASNAMHSHSSPGSWAGFSGFWLNSKPTQDHHDGAVRAGFRWLGIKLICLLGWFGKPVFIG